MNVYLFLSTNNTRVRVCTAAHDDA